MIPIIGIAGNAGAGKGVLSNYLADKYNGVCVAQADPMKQIARLIFDFSEEQLWGPSEERNKLDTRFADLQSEQWVEARQMLAQSAATAKIQDVFGDKYEEALDLFRWEFMRTCEHFAKEKGGLTPRHVLQQMGTAVGRQVDVNIWARAARETCMKLLCGGHSYVRRIGLIGCGNPGYGFAAIDDLRFRNEIIGLRSAGGIAIKIVRPDPSAAEKTAAAGVAGHQSEAELGGIPDHFYDHFIHNIGTLEDLYTKGDGLMSRYRIVPVDKP